MPAFVRILQLAALACVGRVWVADGAPPAVLSAVYETREVGMMSSGEDGDMGHEQYHAALFTVTFDQPLFVNGSVAFDTLSPEAGGDSDVHHYLYGIARLKCGGKLFEAHPPLVPTARDGGGAVPLFLVPLNEPHEHPAHRLFAVFKCAPLTPTVLFLDYTVHGDSVTCVDPDVLSSCVLAFPPEAEQSWWPTARLTNVAGEPFTGRVNLTLADATDDDDEHVRALARTASALQARRKETAERRAREGDDEGGGSDDSKREHSSHQREKNEVAVQVLLEKARGKHFADSNNVVDTTHVYSFLEVLHRVGTLEKVEANQYFELIEDPLLNLLVPMMIDILVSASKSPLIQALCKILERIIPKILSGPTSSEIEMLQTSEGMSNVLASLRGGGGAGGMGPGLDPVSHRPMASDQPPPPPSGRPSTGSDPARAWRDLGAKAEDGVDEAMESAKMEFQELGVSLHSGSGCNTAGTETECKAFSEHKSREKCTWCARKDVNGVVGQCVPCSNMGPLVDSGYKCSPTEEECVDSDEKPKKKKEPEPLDDWGEPPTGTQLEEDIANAVVDGTVTQVAHDAHLGLAANLAKVINGTVVRGASRALTQSLSVALTQQLSITLTSAVAKILTRISTKEITMALTPSLTHALTPSISQALSHKPAVDYYCHYCEKSKMYCEQCHAAAVEDYYRDYYADYYAEYYGRYYAHWYGAVYADLFVSEQMHSTQHSSNPEQGQAP